MKTDTRTKIDHANLTEEQARDYLERLRWGDTPFCPHCGDLAVTRLQGKSTRPGVWKCKGPKCRKQFTVTVGTIFEDSHIPLRKWVMAFYLMCTSKKGVSSLQLQRMLGLKSYKSAWHMSQRVRYAMRKEPMATMLKGIVEVDETWVGPRLRGHGKGLKISNKTPVVALIQRGGAMRTKVVDRVTPENLKQAVNESVHRNTVLMTDERQAYKAIAKDYLGHESVMHSAGEYARGDAHCNTAESFFALLKRGIHGTFHHVSREHLFRYADEFAFRWNHRKSSDLQRTEAALLQAPGKRLTYQESRLG